MIGWVTRDKSLHAAVAAIRYKNEGSRFRFEIAFTPAGTLARLTGGQTTTTAAISRFCEQLIYCDLE